MLLNRIMITSVVLCSVLFCVFNSFNSAKVPELPERAANSASHL